MNTSILVVEDEGLIAIDLKRKLEQAGYFVPMIADSAEDAISGVERHHPNLVMMDIRLRGERDGIQTADQIRRQFQIPVMYVTAHADRETLERAKITEPFGYIVKPFHSVDFRAQIEMAIWKHQMEEKLRVSEAWLSAICRNVADALISSDRNGRIAFMNEPASKLTGWDWREARGKPLLEVFQVFEEATGLPVVHPLEAIYDGREVATNARTFRLRSRNGDDSALVEARLSSNYDEKSLLGIIVVFREVTERRNEEAQYRQLQKINAVTQMATGLGKDLDDSQRHMAEAMTKLVAGIQLSDDSSCLLAETQKRVSHQQALVAQLVILGGTDTRNAVIVDLNEAISEFAPKLRRSLGIGRSLNLRLQQEIPAIRVDPEELRETLLRLIVNARNATPDGGRAEISTAVSETADGRKNIRLTIRDSGKGIRANAKERIFDPYFESRPGIGSPGFSLALAYHFATLSGGTMEAESGSGDGTAYVMTFPAVDGPGENVPLPAAAEEGQTFGASAGASA
jgi:two-component system, cell cycle sensor histidine kinase and response regulator CckA